MVILENINKSYIVYKSVNDPYYNYCISLIKEKLNKCDDIINVVLYYLDFNSYVFNNGNKTIELGIQYEHTLVKNGGRGLNNNTVISDIKTSDGSPYLIRIDKYDNLKKLNYVIEYSLPNIFNVSRSTNFDDYLKKNLYISPLIELNLNKSDLKKDTITLFSNNYSERRSGFYNSIIEKKVKCENKIGYYSENELIELYKTTKILVNIHQTEHHHTFEELRVLPALCRGVIIISEDVPLKNKIPYGEHIIWCNYDEIVDKIIETQNNYDLIFDKVFNNKLIKILNDMGLNNKITINNIKL
jgi:hypothetical protein